MAYKTIRNNLYTPMVEIAADPGLCLLWRLPQREGHKQITQRQRSPQMQVLVPADAFRSSLLAPSKLVSPFMQQPQLPTFSSKERSSLLTRGLVLSTLFSPHWQASAASPPARLEDILAK
eukprot:c10724_g1_i1 orf=36-395(+)